MGAGPLLRSCDQPEDGVQRRAEFVREGGEKFILHPAAALGLRPGRALTREQFFAFALRGFARCDVDRGSIEAHRLAGFVVVGAAHRPHPLHRAGSGRDRAVIGFIQRVPGDGLLDLLPHPLPIARMQPFEEKVDRHLFRWINPKMPFRALVPFQMREWQWAIPEPDIRAFQDQVHPHPAEIERFLRLFPLRDVPDESGKQVAIRMGQMAERNLDRKLVAVPMQAESLSRAPV